MLSRNFPQVRNRQIFSIRTLRSPICQLEIQSHGIGILVDWILPTSRTQVIFSRMMPQDVMMLCSLPTTPRIVRELTPCEFALTRFIPFIFQTRLRRTMMESMMVSLEWVRESRNMKCGFLTVGET